METFDYLMLAKMLGTLGLVVALIYVLGWLLSKMQVSRTAGGDAMRLLGGLSVGSKERVVMLEVNGERLLLGVAPGSVTAIGRVNGDQIDLTNQPEPAVPGAEAS